MAKNYSLFIAASILLLAVSIIASAIILSKAGMEKTSSVEKPAASPSSVAIMTLNELADYLSVSEVTIEGIMEEDLAERASGDVHDIEKHIPFVELKNKRLFVKSEIDEWLKYKSGFYGN